MTKDNLEELVEELKKALSDPKFKAFLKSIEENEECEEVSLEEGDKYQKETEESAESFLKTGRKVLIKKIFHEQTTEERAAVMLKGFEDVAVKVTTERVELATVHSLHKFLIMKELDDECVDQVMNEFLDSLEIG